MMVSVTGHPRQRSLSVYRRSKRVFTTSTRVRYGSLVLALIAMLIGIVGLFPQQAAHAADSGPGLARGKLYSTAAVKRLCTEAQQIIAGTTLDSTNNIHDTSTSFIVSDAAPYESPEGATLPLTTQQFVTYGTYPAKGKQYPQIISCKMKSAEALAFFYGADAAHSGASCRDIHEQTVNAVFASLTKPETRQLVFDRDDVIIDSDSVARSGPQWLTPMPPTLTYMDAEGRLHLQAKSLPVPREVPPFVPLGPEKKGVHYCHLAAPEYIRALITGDVAP